MSDGLVEALRERANEAALHARGDDADEAEHEAGLERGHPELVLR